ncbi:hypothetical protein L2E82_29781 [Cichorium intybus]|uniref:Uncharacterized protein n=1 Tax=Cichorium intybus TaxID=13427 RepID=A0ACB9CZ70_CICIN|nr:hypothetical protein L2E82_29781 [Cichorium intybus]
MDERWRVSGRRRWEIARVSIDSQNIGRRLFAGNLEWLAMDGKNLIMEMSWTMGGASDETINTAHPGLHLFARNIKPPMRQPRLIRCFSISESPTSIPAIPAYL